MTDKFFIGAATAAHQVEGGNIYSDAWAMENMAHSAYAEKSGACCDHYNRYKEDIDYLSKAGLNAFRFSIEWARIEPENGRFDEAAINHYRQVTEYCVSLGITPIVTLFHFSSPVWLIKEGGWESEKTISYFKRYVGYVIKNLGDLLSFVCTINEANMGMQIALMAKKLQKGTLQIGLDLNGLKKLAAAKAQENAEVFSTPSPQVFLSARSERGEKIIFSCHEAARKIIKDFNPKIKVGITLSLYDVQSLSGGGEYARNEWYGEFEKYLPYLSDDDFIGVQNYTKKVFDSTGEVQPAPDKILPDTGYEYSPEAVGNVAEKVYSSAHIPVLITENGIATPDDELRCKFIGEALSGVKKAMQNGAEIIGYIYWSLLDNFEWQKGFSVKFGLIGVDRKTMGRILKKSLYYLGERSKDYE